MARKSSSRRSPKGASLRDLQSGTHRGRPTATRVSNGSPFISGNGLAKLTAPVMMHGVTPTPHGPEPHWPSG